MNANNKETKSASKAQKKTQKANKKQQQQKQQQQQQQQQQINSTRRNSNGKNSQTTSTTTTTSFGNNNGVIVNGGNGGSNRVNGKPTKTLHNNQQISYTNNNNNNININNNNNNIKSKDTIYNNNTIENNNNTTEPVNISKKLKDYYVSEKNKTIATTTPTTTTTMPGYENVPKMERSNSFSLRGKLSKLINSITGSKENLPKATDEENGKAPYSFTRSRSMILLRRPNRRSLIEPQLEQLSEEAEKSNDTMSPTSPRKNSLAETAESDTAESPVQLRRRADTLADQRTAAAAAAVAAAGALRVDGVITPARRQSAQPFTASTPLEEFERLQRKPSLISLTPSETSYNPQLNFQKRRSNTLIASFKSTFAGLATSSEQKKKEKMNPKWSASLQSLQAIDNMVSYENMSFIDYDKFNGYEKQLERQLSIMSINERQQQLQQQLQQQQQQQYRQPTSPAPMLNNSNNNNSVSRGSLRSMDFTPPNVGGTSSQSPSMTTPQTVVRRRKHSPSSMAAHWPSATSPTASATRRRKSSSRTSLRSVNSFNFDTDYEHNLDKLRNVYRDSLDSRKLELLNELSRNSFILDKHVVDVLNLEDGSVDCRRRATCTTHRRQTSYTGSGGNGSGRDVVDATNSHTGAQLKSKSLTHLDGLDSMIACQHGPPSAATTTTAAASTMTATSLTAASARQHQQQQYQQANVVSSSEYFSVNFCMEGSGSGIGGGSNCQDEEFIPAMKGVTLFTALAPALRKRGFTFSQINITDNNPTPSFLDAGISPLASSLDENTEVENLAGHHLIVTERESSRKTLQKAASFGSRTRPPRLLSSASTEETSESVGATGKQIKQRWSGLFGTKNPSQSQLCDLLNSYAKNGVPQKTASLNFSHPDFDAAVAYIDNMHKSWRDFVDSEGMSDSEVKIQTAIWELVTTEVYYIHALQTVTDLFLACLEALQDERLLADVDQHKLFSNVRDICEANLKFWTIYLYPMVAHSVTTREPLRCAFFQDGFVNFASIFAPYKKYCAEQSTCHFYCKELNRTNALFTSYLAWCESQKMCNRLKLADIIVRPMQRLTKYNLLLGAIKKHMSDVDEIEAVDTMLHSVENFVCSVNNHLTMRQENERLKGVMARIESYDVVDTNNEQLDKLIKHYSQMFDLCAPMKDCPAHQVRHLFMEGDHKFKDNLGKADVHCFLLTDMLLVCKTIAKKGLGTLKVIRQPYLTDRLMVNMAPNNSNTLNCVYLNEFEVAVTAFTLQCLEAKKWYEALRRTKLIYTRLKQGTSGNWGDLRFGGSSTSGGNADSLGVKKSPMNSSICSHVSSANNSHSGSVEWNDSRNISVDFEKTNSLSSDEGSSLMIGAHHAAGVQLKNKQLISGQHKLKIANASSANTLSVQPVNHLGQSLPNLNLHHSHTPQSQHNSPGINATVSGSNVSIGMGVGVGVGVGVAGLQKSLPALITNNLDQAMQQKLLLQQHQQQHQQQQQQQQPAIQLSNQNLTEQLTSNETDV